MYSQKRGLYKKEMKNKTVLITGSSKGLGEELALVFASNKHDMILHGRNKEDLGRVKEKVSKTGVNCYILEGDLRLDKTIEELYKLAKEKDVSVLINNAGVHCPKLPFEKINDKQIDDLLLTNLIAPIKLTCRIYPLFLKSGQATIININSISGLENQKFRTLYGASKWGLRGFSEILKLETEKNKIRIIDVYPSRIRTRPEFTVGMGAEDVAKKIYEVFKSTNLNKITLDDRSKKHE